MKAQTFAGGPGYFFILVGVVLALVSAMVPHFGAGYHLQFSVFAVGLLPWLVYGITVPLLRNVLLDAIGLLLVVIHAWLVFSERFMKAADYSNNMIYLVPIILSVLLIPLAIAVILRQWRTAKTGNE
ncbi:MAG: hypothetical protein LJE83_05145 [Gammaproteobacteria bacterium]|nr:hypothetical protein [Gammaproteobacteria bacterium]